MGIGINSDEEVTDHSDEERRFLRSALERAGLNFRFDEAGGEVAAVFAASSPAHADPCSVLVDAPVGWLRVCTYVELGGEPTLPDLRSYDHVYRTTGFGMAGYDRGKLRLSVTLQRNAPLGSPLLAAVQHLLDLRARMTGGLPHPAAVAHEPPAPFVEAPTLEDAVLALGAWTPFAWQTDGSFLTRFDVDTGKSYTGRLFTSQPGVLTFETSELSGPKRSATREDRLRLARVCASMVVGQMLLTDDGMLSFRWSVPYLWLDLEHLRDRPLLVSAMLDAWMMVQGAEAQDR